MTFVGFLSTWGWIILTVVFLLALLGEGFRLKVVLTFGIFAWVLWYFAGFNADFFNPKELHMESLFAFIAGLVAGWGGLFLLFALLCCMFPLVEHEHEGWAFGTLAAIVVLAYFMGWNLPSMAWNNKAETVAFVIAWFAFGGGWSAFKWNRYGKTESAKHRESILRFCADWVERLTRENDPHLRGWEYYLTDLKPKIPQGQEKAVRDALLTELQQNKVPDRLLSAWESYGTIRKPTALQSKEKILNWIMFWPWSLLTYALYDFLRDIAEKVWEWMNGIYTRIMDRHYADIDPRLMKKSAIEQ